MYQSFSLFISVLFLSFSRMNGKTNSYIFDNLSKVLKHQSLSFISWWCITPKRHLEKLVKNALYMSKGGIKRFIIAKYNEKYGFLPAIPFWLLWKQKAIKRFAERYLPNRSSNFSKTLIVFLGDA